MLEGLIIGGIIWWITDDRPLGTWKDWFGGDEPQPEPSADSRHTKPSLAVAQSRAMDMPEQTQQARRETAAALHQIAKHLEDGVPVPEEVVREKEKYARRTAVILRSLE